MTRVDYSEDFQGHIKTVICICTGDGKCSPPCKWNHWVGSSAVGLYCHGQLSLIHHLGHFGICLTLVHILLRSFLFSDNLLKGVLYNVLISVACVALQQCLESTLNGKSVNQQIEFRWKGSPWHICVTHTGVSNTPSKPLASFSSHLLEPFATDPYSELCFAKMRCQALIFLKVTFF